MATVTSSASARSKKKSEKVTTFSSWVIKASLYLLVFMMPLFFLPYTFDALEFNKQNILLILTLVALVGWLGKVINEGKFEVKKTILNTPVLFFLGIYALAAVFSIDKYQSFLGEGSQFVHSFLTVGSFVLLFFIIVNNLESVKHVKGILMTLFVSAFLVGLNGFFQMMGWFVLPIDSTKTKAFNLIGTFNGFGLFAAFILTLVIAYLIASFVDGKKKWNQDVKVLAETIGLWVLGGLMFVNIVLIDYWVIWVALLIAMVFLLAFSFSRANTMNTKWLMLPMIMLVISVLFQFVTLPLNLSLPTEVSPNSRASWEIAKSGLAENPLFGSGPGTYMYDYAKFKPASVNTTNFWTVRFDRASSNFLTNVTTMGVLGIVAWLIVMGAFLFLISTRFMKSKSDANWLLGVGLLSGFIFLFVAKFLYPVNMSLEFMSWLLIGLLTFYVVQQNESKTFVLEKSPKLALLLSFSFIIVVTISASGIYLIGQRYAADIDYRKGLDLAAEGPEKFQAISDELQRAVTLNKYRDNFYSTLGRLYSGQLDEEVSQLTDQADEDQRLQVTRNVQILIDGAISSAKRATELGPSNVENWNILAAIYQKLIPVVAGSDTFAIDAYKKSIELEPANPVFYTELASVYLAQYDLTQRQLNADGADQLPNKAELEKTANDSLELAEENLLKAIELKGNYAQAHFQMALLHVRKGDTDKAIQELEVNRLANPRDVALGLQLGIMYYQNDQKDKAIAELERITKLAPNYSNALWYLAAMYEDGGRSADALAAMEKVAALNPDNEIVAQRLSDLQSGTANSTPELPEPVENEPEPIPVEPAVPAVPAQPEATPAE